MDNLKLNLGTPKAEDFSQYKLDLFANLGPPKKQKKTPNLYKRQLRFIRRQKGG